jgi:transglutaminase-like putative cysteine protease
MIKYKITHTTTYNYAAPVAVCHNLAYLSPRSGPRQTCRTNRVVVKPHPSAATSKRTDYFGNIQHAFAVEQPFRRLSVTATSQVAVHPGALPDADATPAWEHVRDALDHGEYPPAEHPAQFRFASPLIRPSADLRAYAQPSFTADRPILAALRDLTTRIHADFEYDPAATDVATPPEEVFAKRRGVCQDLAHVQIGCLRSLGLPARYVSGYLRTLPPEGEKQLVGADASHAWVSVFCGDVCGWIDVDPTNDCFALDDHIQVAWGREYRDVAPLAGTFLGGGRHELKVAVSVKVMGGAAEEAAAAGELHSPS